MIFSALRVASGLVTLFLLFSCEPVFAQQQALSGEMKQKSLLASRPLFEFFYTGKTDLAQEESRKDFSHQLYLNSKYSTQVADLSMGTGLIIEAVGNNITKENDNPSFDDLYLGISKGYQPHSRLNYIFEYEHALPTGKQSRIEEIKSISTGRVMILHQPARLKLSFLHLLEASYVYNTYEVSPLSFQFNSDYNSRYEFRVSYSVTNSWKLGAKASIANVHFINGDNEIKNSTSQFIKFQQKKWSTTLTHLMGTYDENDHVRFLYQDNTKQRISLGVEVEI
jgi:hypothetical protein